MNFPLHNTPYPDGTTVGAYDATGYSGAFPGNNPPGVPVAEATASGRTVEFNGLTVNTRYIAAAKVGGEWRYITFTPEAAPGAVEGPENKEAIETLEETVETLEGAIESFKDNAVLVVVHGSDPSVERPDAKKVIWDGSVEPENMVEPDSWEETP